MLTDIMLDPVAELEPIIAGLDRDIREPTRLRAALVPELRRVLEEGHRAAEAQLLADRNGMACAQSLSRLTDAVVRAIHDAVVWRLYPNDNPTTGEQLAVVATGGYGRGRWRRARTSICCSCSPTSRPRGPRASWRRCSTSCGT